MIDTGKARLNRLTSGIATLDTILGGGFPEYSFNLIAGDPGAGKTTLCHQIMFANATPERPAVYFTVVGEPPIKMLRYQQQFSFFDPARLRDGSIHFVNLSQDAGRLGSRARLDRDRSRATQPGARCRRLIPQPHDVVTACRRRADGPFHLCAASCGSPYERPGNDISRP